MTLEPDRQTYLTDGRVLVLDPTYSPVAVVHWSKAVTLLMTEKASAVSETEHVISSPSVELFLPSVILLTTMVPSNRRRVAIAKRRAIFETHRWTCCYCGLRPKTQHERALMTIDHVLPRAQGGANVPINMVVACKPCNGRKADRTPDQAGMKMLYPAREPAWAERLQMTFVGTGGHTPDDWRPFLNQ